MNTITKNDFFTTTKDSLVSLKDKFFEVYDLLKQHLTKDNRSFTNRVLNAPRDVIDWASKMPDKLNSYSNSVVGNVKYKYDVAKQLGIKTVSKFDNNLMSNPLEAISQMPDVLMALSETPEGRIILGDAGLIDKGLVKGEMLGHKALSTGSEIATNLKQKGSDAIKYVNDKYYEYKPIVAAKATELKTKTENFASSLMPEYSTPLSDKPNLLTGAVTEHAKKISDVNSQQDDMSELRHNDMKDATIKVVDLLTKINTALDKVNITEGLLEYDKKKVKDKDKVIKDEPLLFNINNASATTVMNSSNQISNNSLTSLGGASPQISGGTTNLGDALN